MGPSKPADTMLTVLVPCYNERESIPWVCDEIRALQDLIDTHQRLEILFVDDGSTDGTADAIPQNARGFQWRIVAHQTNLGLGAAIRTGVRESRSDEIACIDCDGSYDLRQIPILLSALRRGADIVTGSPYHPDGVVANVVRWRLFLSRLLSRIYGSILPLRLHTYTSCFRVYRRECFQMLPSKSNGFLAVTEVLAEAILLGLRVDEVPVRLDVRKFGSSKMSFFSVSADHIAYLFRLLLRRVVSRKSCQTPRKFLTTERGHHAVAG